MKRALPIIIVVALACSRSTLATTSSVAPAVAPPATVVGATPVYASFGDTWDAAIDVLTRQSVNLKTVDPFAGLVVAEISSVPYRDLTTYTTDCGGQLNTLSKSAGVATASYNIIVTGDSAKSKVKVRVSVKKGGASCSTRGSFETALQNDIRRRAERS